MSCADPEAEVVWRGGNEHPSPLSALRFPRPWQRQVGEREASPYRHRFDGERRPLLLLPRAQARLGARCAGFMGGKHSTFNMALWDGFRRTG
jgi:CelD/BcsL family acetyltransferase involved in cellulose biosynthesis